MHDKLSALDKPMRYHNLYSPDDPDDYDQSTEEKLVDEIIRILEEAAEKSGRQEVVDALAALWQALCDETAPNGAMV